MRSILQVDKIDGAEKVVSFCEEDKILEVKISASTARNLRSAIGSVLEQTKLALRTLRAFSEQYSVFSFSSIEENDKKNKRNEKQKQQYHISKGYVESTLQITLGNAEYWVKYISCDWLLS